MNKNNCIKRVMAAAIMITAAFSTNVIADENISAAETVTEEKDVFTPEGVMSALPTKNTDPTLYVQVNCDNLNMRSDSNENTRLIKTLPNKYALSVLGAEYGWVQVQDDDGNKGYVNAKEMIEDIFDIEIEGDVHAL